TFDQTLWDSIDCIAVGDADNDGDNDIVIGTRPFGGLVVYENTGNENSVEFTQIVIANFSFDYYGAVAFISDIVIADLDGTGNNSILVGTTYFTTGYFGDVVSFNKTNNVWQEEDFLNGGNAIQGGVYSLDVGEVGPSSENLVAVGQGFDSTRDNCNVTLYKKDIDNWIEEEVIQTYQSRILVSIGDFTTDYDGNEILFCTATDNCSLVYIAYDSGIIHQDLFGGFPGWYNERFNWMDMGDLNGDGLDEAVVSVKRTLTIDTDSIEIYNGMPNISLFSGFYLLNNEFEVNDFDNDGRDEVVFVYTTSITYPDVRLKYIDWNGTAYETHNIENTIELDVPSITLGDVDNDGSLETLYGTDGNGWLRLLDWIDDEFTVDCDKSPVVSLVEGKFNLTCTVKTHAWGIQGISVSLVLPGAINSTTPTTTIDIGDKLGPSSTIVEWQLDPLSYGIYNIDLTTTTANFGVNLTTLSVTVTDLEVRNVLSSALTEEVGEYITLSGQVVFVHNSFPVDSAEVYLDGISVTTTDPAGLFSFQHTESSSGLKNYNITATLDNEVKISKCAGYYIIQVEWTSAISEYRQFLSLSLLVPVVTVSIVLILKKKHKKI
ncbi:MAG: hypothetical protein H7641_11490, partial [Candidatus Heimdallarchaeota archaeon]|nr:hypothetical protein [Candidatus Heimdallarchaeota archaeon]MCK4878183.1 hypothetical protein [Candidatus Heimdallarchaeota archaeon]